MAQLPKLEIEVFQKLNKDGTSSKSLGMVDFTKLILETSRENPTRLVMFTKMYRPVTDAYYIADSVSASLGLSYSETSKMINDVIIPDFGKAVENFVNAFDKDELAFLRSQRTRLEELMSALRNAQAELTNVEKSTWSNNVNAYDVVWSPFIGEHDGYVDQSDDIYHDWNWDDFVSRYNIDKESDDVIEPKYAEYKRNNASPYCYATTNLNWQGITIERILKIIEDFDGNAITARKIMNCIDNMIESDMDHFYDEAYLDIKNERELTEIVKGFLTDKVLQYFNTVLAFKDFKKRIEDYNPDFPKIPDVLIPPPEELKDFSEKLDAWNKKQNITSCYLDKTITLPALKGATKKSSLKWCHVRIQDIQNQIDTIQDSWSEKTVTSKTSEDNTHKDFQHIKI